MKTGLDGIARLEEVLPIHIRNEYLLVAIFEPVQAAVCILLEHREIRRIVLVAVGAQVAENAQTRSLSSCCYLKSPASSRWTPDHIDRKSTRLNSSHRL